jgi:hypothetical protein
MDVTLTGHPAVVVALARASALLGRHGAHAGGARTARDRRRVVRRRGRHAAHARSKRPRRRRTDGEAAGEPDASSRRSRRLPVCGRRTSWPRGSSGTTARQRLLVSSIRRRRIDAVRRDGSVSTFIDLARDSAWVASRARGRLPPESSLGRDRMEPARDQGESRRLGTSGRPPVRSHLRDAPQAL